MKFAKKIETVKAMPDSDLKLSKLETLALQAFPNGGTQRDLLKEAGRLREAGYKIPIPEKYQPKPPKVANDKKIKEQKMKQKENDKTTKKIKAKQEKQLRPNPFAGKNDVYLTPNKIAVTTTVTRSAKRGHVKVTKTKYYEQNNSNIKLLKAAKGKTVRVGRTGNTYKDI